MKMKYLIFTLVLAVSATGVANATCTDAQKTALETLDRAWAKAGETGDRAALTRIYADGFVAMPAMLGKAATIDNTIATAAAGAAAGPVVHDRYLFSCTANTATITHRNIINEPGPDGKMQTFWTRSVHFLEKTGGSWQVVSSTSHEMDDHMMIGYLDMDWNAATLKRDKKWFETNYADDFSSIGSRDGKLLNKAQAIAEDIDSATTMEIVESADVNIRLEGNTAVVNGIFRTKGRDASGAFDRRVRYTDTWIKRNGRWQVWASQGTLMN
jgi:ketosteroid isomerase-like protein